MSNHRLFEIAGILSFGLLEVYLGWRVLGAVGAGLHLGWVAAALLAGFVAADFASGLIHWGFDRYGSRDTPVVGANFIVPFREHHVDPKGITRHDFVETNGNNCIATLLVLLPVLAVEPTAGVLNAVVVTTVASMCFFVMGTNQFHKWAHEDEPPALVVALMKAHLILETKHHDVHHTPPFDQYYCITTGWLNPLLDKVQFFKRTEALILAVTGIHGGEDDAKVLTDKA